jgi:predicted transcriptional regulator
MSHLSAKTVRDREMLVYTAIRKLNRNRQPANNTAVATAAGISRFMAGRVTAQLAARGFIQDDSACPAYRAAFNWRAATTRTSETE